jgi:SOS-response transcriptional repressor LexA
MKNCKIDRLEEFVEYGECFEVRVNGESMLPLLGYGSDTLIIRRVDTHEPIEGRIAMYRPAPNHYITHRVMRTDGNNVYLLGDGRLTYDAPIPRDNIVGIVEGVIRQDGHKESCTSLSWRIRERLWLMQPLIIRRFTLAIIRRWMKLTKR